MSVTVVPQYDGVKLPPLKVIKYQQNKWNGFKIVAIEKRWGRKFLVTIKQDVQLTVRKIEKLPTIKERANPSFPTKV